MGRVSELWDERQIQILVLLSFMLQVFLFFTGSIRNRSTNIFLRFFLWIAYLGADSVAVYVLGLLSRQQDGPTEGGRLNGTHPLAFVWAPFLLIHLGGQDTITAFAIEDNNLWLRHFLNLVVQVALALYVYWKSSVWRNVHLLAAGIFIFVAGIVKYGERTMALKYGTLKSLESFTADDNKLPQQTLAPTQHFDYSDVIRTALNTVVGVREVFGGRTILQMSGTHRNAFRKFPGIESWEFSLKVLEVELRLIYDDLYSKTRILRTRTGIVFRCISHVSIVVALVIYTLSDKQRYSKVDVAITYTLFVGGICLEVCAAFMILMSAWTWGCLETENPKCGWLAAVSWYVLSSRIALPEKRTLWSNSMGQYDFVSYAGKYDSKSMSWKRRLMKMIRGTVNFVGFGKGTLLWFSKLLDTTEVTVDKDIIKLFSQGVHHYSIGSSAHQQDFLNLSPVLSRIQQLFGSNFGGTVVFLHMFTAVHLSKYSSPLPSGDMDANPAGGTKQINNTVEVCRKLSNYMLYLFVTHPEMLPANGSTEHTLDSFLERIVATEGSSNIDGNTGSDSLVSKASVALRHKWSIPDVQPCKESLEEIRDIWIRLIIYMAGKSRPEMHAAHLARGGELFTFAWLLMLHNELGDSGIKRIELSGHQGNAAYVYHSDNSQGPPA